MKILDHSLKKNLKKLYLNLNNFEFYGKLFIFFVKNCNNESLGIKISIIERVKLQNQII